MPKSPILGGFSTSRSPSASDNESVNLGIEIIETKDGKVPGFLYLASGLDLVGTLGAGPIRGAHKLQDMLYVVSGSQVYSLTPNGVSTLCGTIGNRTSPVSMFDNGQQMMIVDGVGAWLVPGGYPLTGGTLSSGGGLYAINDTITLIGATGAGGAISSYPILTVTAVTNNPVTGFGLANAGTTYTTATNVATTPIASQPGIGTGLTLNIAATGGPIATAVLGVGGTNYAVGDTGKVTTYSGDAVYQVTAVSAGVVTQFAFLNRGSSYVTSLGQATTAGVGAVPNTGIGLTVNITASGGPITASAVANGGSGYAPGMVGKISGGTDDATYEVGTIGPTGCVTAFTVTTPGAANPVAASYSQKATSGSGSGFTLASPTFGAFIGIVPVTLPFSNPVRGGVTDGFGVLVFLGQQVIAASNELDLSTWQALSFGVADQSPDNCNSLVILHDEAYILKDTSVEVWQDAGTSPFPLAPLTSVHMEYGCMAPFSAVVAGGALIWLSRNDQGQGIVMRTNAYNPEPISTQAMAAEFGTYPNLGDAIAYARQEGGHEYYVLTFPEANKTWELDLTASKMASVPIWHRLASWSDGAWGRHWGNCFTPWKGSVALINTTTAYQPESVLLGAASLTSEAALVGMPPNFAAAVMSVWLDLASTDSIQVALESGGSSAAPRFSFNVTTSQIFLTAQSTGGALIVSAVYSYSASGWINLLVSIDTATQQLQVFVNAIVANALVETHLTATSIAWSSSSLIDGENLWFNIGATGASGVFWNDGGVLATYSGNGYPVLPAGLAAGAVWNDGMTIAVISGITPNPAAPPVYFGSITPAALLALGGGNLPLTNPGSGSGQLWNDGGVVSIA